jgi:hopanoid biosynthesis associated protein HpnK
MILFIADDFGSSREVNEAIIEVHQKGVLHGASLMMGEDATVHAVALAKANPTLRVGLHLVLTDGKSVLPHYKIPRLVDKNRNFSKSPASRWLSYLFNPLVGSQLEEEIKNQFKAFQLTGLKLSHVDGHHHMHIHPRVWRLVVEQAQIYGAQWVRIPWEDSVVWKKASDDPAFWKFAHIKIYHFLCKEKKSLLKKIGFHTFDSVFGIAETFSMTKSYVLKILRENPPGLYEFYFHPGKTWNKDLQILLDPEVVQEAQKFKLEDPWRIVF